MYNLYYKFERSFNVSNSFHFGVSGRCGKHDPFGDYFDFGKKDICCFPVFMVKGPI